MKKLDLPNEEGTPGIVARSCGIVRIAVIGSRRISFGIDIYRSVAAKTRIQTMMRVSLLQRRDQKRE